MDDDEDFIIGTCQVIATTLLVFIIAGAIFTLTVEPFWWM